MKKIWILLSSIFCIFCIFCVFFTACTNHTADLPKEQGETVMYEQITPQKAKELMENESDYVILDVREQDEFEEGHIEGAILIPYTQINAKAEEILLAKDQLIQVFSFMAEWVGFEPTSLKWHHDFELLESLFR